MASTTAEFPTAATAGPGVIDLVRGFTGEPRRHRRSPMFIAGLAVTSVVLLLIVLSYFGLLAFLGWLIYAQIEGGLIDPSEVSRSGYRGRAAIAAAGLPLVRIVGCAILLLVLMKPLLAPRMKRELPEFIARNREPRLYDLCDRICDLLHAPKPRRIVLDASINASASYERGLWGILRGDYTLTIGLPLVAGLDVRSLSGVIAHEVGHFSQRTSLALQHVIHSVNTWLFRLAYERDSWDQALHEAMWGLGGYGVILIGPVLVSLFVSRLVFMAMAHVAAAVSCFMSRQAEYDSDAYQCALTGSADFERASRRIDALSSATGIVHARLGDWYRQRRLPDNLPAVLAAFARSLPAEQLNKRFRVLRDTRTGVFETHPSTGDRMRYAESLNEPGVCAIEAPAAGLLNDFESACRVATYLEFRALLGGEAFEITFTPAREFLAELGLDHERTDAVLRRWMPEEVSGTLSIRPVFLSMTTLEAPGDPRQAARQIQAAAAEMRRLAPGAAKAARAIRAADDRIDDAVQLQTLIRAGLKPEPTQFGFHTASIAGCEAEIERSVIAMNTAASAMDEFCDALRLRLGLCLRLLAISGVERYIPGAADLRTEVGGLLEANAALRQAHPGVAGLQRVALAEMALRTRFGGGKLPRKLFVALTDLLKSVDRDLREAHHAMEQAPYPFETPLKPVSIARLYVPNLPIQRLPLEDLLFAAGALRDGHQTTYRRVLTRLIEIAERVEVAIKTGER